MGIHCWSRLELPHLINCDDFLEHSPMRRQVGGVVYRVGNRVLRPIRKDDSSDLRTMGQLAQSGRNVWKGG